MTLTHLSLFSGIGGLDLAAEWAGFETVGQCEWADFPSKVLEKHWPDVPRWRDIRTLNGESFYERTGCRTVDVISGGFPCQPFSVAGNQKGKEDERYLWPEMLRVIRELAPRWVIGENVPGILHIAAADVVKDMERLGYHVVVFAFEAAAVGARHRRERIFFVANAKHDGRASSEITGSIGARSDRSQTGTKSAVEPSRCGKRDGRERDVADASRGKNDERERRDVDEAIPRRESIDSAVITRRKTISNPTRERCGEAREHSQRPEERTTGGGAISNSDSTGLERRTQSGNAGRERSQADEQPAGSDREPTSDALRAGLPITGQQSGQRPVSASLGTELGDWWSTEPDVGRVAHGVPSRVDRLKCLGNAVVPQQVYPICRAIYEILAAPYRADDTTGKVKED